jgi:hypothetical protein
MNPTILDKILIENNLYQKNGVVFSNTTPQICYGSLFKVLPQLLEKKTQKEVESE